jgi:hypothetical protein
MAYEVFDGPYQGSKYKGAYGPDLEKVISEIGFRYSTNEREQKENDKAVEK